MIVLPESRGFIVHPHGGAGGAALLGGSSSLVAPVRMIGGTAASLGGRAALICNAQQIFAIAFSFGPPTLAVPGSQIGVSSTINNLTGPTLATVTDNGSPVSGNQGVAGTNFNALISADSSTYARSVTVNPGNSIYIIGLAQAYTQQLVATVQIGTIAVSLVINSCTQPAFGFAPNLTNAALGSPHQRLSSVTNCNLPGYFNVSDDHGGGGGGSSLSVDNVTFSSNMFFDPSINTGIILRMAAPTSLHSTTTATVVFEGVSQQWKIST